MLHNTREIAEIVLMLIDIKEKIPLIKNYITPIIQKLLEYF